MTLPTATPEDVSSTPDSLIARVRTFLRSDMRTLRWVFLTLYALIIVGLLLFGINGEPDDVHMVDTRQGRVWVGLPARESGHIADLVERGEIGLELCHDPTVSIVIGVYAMRPVGR